jgi:hypothetical protein
VVTLLLFLFACAGVLLVAYPTIQEQRKNTRPQEELQHQLHHTQRLRALPDALATG